MSLSEVAESLIQTPIPLLFQYFWIRNRVRQFFNFENPTPVQTPATNIDPTEIYTCFTSDMTTQTPATSNGVSRLGLGLETCLETHFWSLGLEGLKSRLGLEEFRSRSRALSLETLHRLFFMKFCKKELLKKRFWKMIVQTSAIQSGQWLSFLCCDVICEMEKTTCPLPRLKFILISIKNVYVPMKPQRIISATRRWEYIV